MFLLLTIIVTTTSVPLYIRFLASLNSAPPKRTPTNIRQPIRRFADHSRPSSMKWKISESSNSVFQIIFSLGKNGEQILFDEYKTNLHERNESNVVKRGCAKKGRRGWEFLKSRNNCYVAPGKSMAGKSTIRKFETLLKRSTCHRVKRSLKERNWKRGRKRKRKTDVRSNCEKREDCCERFRDSPVTSSSSFIGRRFGGWRAGGSHEYVRCPVRQPASMDER